MNAIESVLSLAKLAKPKLLTPNGTNIGVGVGMGEEHAKVGMETGSPVPERDEFVSPAWNAGNTRLP